MADVISRTDSELRSEMVEMQTQVARWVTEQKHSADTVALNGVRVLETDKENVVQLRDNLKEVAAAEEALQQRAAEERLRIDEQRAELERLTAQESRLPPEAERLNQQLAQARSLVVQREAGCETSLASKEQKLSELDRGCALYRTRLGLAFERVGDERLRLTFTNIDPADPMRSFAFQVFVDGGDKYHVESCEPLVQGMDELLGTLNRDNDFSAFVRSMRRRFKESV